VQLFLDIRGFSIIEKLGKNGAVSYLTGSVMDFS